MQNHITNYGINFIKKHEGLRLKAYLCPGGFWTIGYGHKMNNRDIEQISENEAELLLQKDLINFEYAVFLNVKPKLTWYQFDALVSLVFNIGINAFKRSTLRQKINYGEIFSVKAEFMRWCWSGGKKLQGLLNRRLREAELFEGIFVA